MAITSNNIYSLQLLRNGAVYANKEAAYNALSGATALESVVKKDGVAVLARYIHEEGGTKQIRTLVGYYADASAMTEASGGTNYMTIVDTDGTAADVEELKARLGDGVTTANTVTDQLTALSGNSATAQSSDTSVEGAKKYADEKIAQAVDALDYTGVTTGTGVYVTNVTENNGVVSATTATLPTVADSASAKTFVTSVSENLGEISVSKGTITSSGKTIVLTDNADGGVNFEANVDGTTIVIDENTGTMSVASSALVQYEGDDDTIQISAVSQGVRTVSSPLTIEKVTTGLSADVKEEYHLVGHSGNTIGDAIKIYKDSSLLSVALLHAITNENPQVLPTYNKATNAWTDIDATAQTEANQALCYAYENVSGDTIVAAVPVGSFINEQEFASGITWDSTEGKVRGVVDPTSEKDSQDTPVDFLTVGANGFKISGIKDEIDRQLDAVVEVLDATVSGETSGGHITISIEELDGKLVQSGLTITEDNIANADDLEELSAKTVTEIASSNSSITVATAATTAAAADGTVKYDVITDASKIQMSGFTGADVLSGITQSSSITEAFLEVDKVITENEETVSAALNDLEESKVENIVVNGVTGTFNNKIASVTIDGNDVVLGADYAKPTQGSAITTADTVDQALGKLEAKVDAAVASGVTSIVAGDGIAVDATQQTTPTVSAKLTATSDLPSGIAENAIKFDATSAPGMYIEYIDCGTY